MKSINQLVLTIGVGGNKGLEKCGVVRHGVIIHLLVMASLSNNWNKFNLNRFKVKY